MEREEINMNNTFQDHKDRRIREMHERMLNFRARKKKQRKSF